MLAGLSRWAREGSSAHLVPSRVRARLERWSVGHADLTLHHWRPGDAPDSVFSGLQGLARSADALILNLETQLTASSVPAGTVGESLRADPAATGVLSYLGVTAVICANNHCLDYGSEGLGDSTERLERAGIAVAGVVGPGRDGGAVVSVGGIRVGLPGFTDDWRVTEAAALGCRPAPHEPARVRERIGAMKSVADLVVVQLHWGYEWSMYPMLTLRNLARSYVESGASLVVCHHAHVPMGFETWHRGAIAHGLGNLYFGPTVRERHLFRNSSYVLRAEISSAGVVAGEIVPVVTDAEGRAGPDSGQSADTLRNAVAFLSSRLADDDYLGRVEASLTARHGCAVLQGIHRRVQAGDVRGARERVRLLEPPRQRALVASLGAARGLLKSIAGLLEALREGRAEPSAPSVRCELERLSRWAGRYLDRSPQKGRIP